MNTYTLPISTADGIDHGKARIEDCLGAVIERFEDGYVLCPILWSGGTCEECMEQWERYEERNEQATEKDTGPEEGSGAEVLQRTGRPPEQSR